MTLAWSLVTRDDAPLVRALARRLATGLAAGVIGMAAWTVFAEPDTAGLRAALPGLAAGLAGTVGGLLAGGPVPAVTSGIAGGLAVGVIVPRVAALDPHSGLYFAPSIMPALIGGAAAAFPGGLAAGLACGQRIWASILRAAVGSLGGMVLGQAGLAVTEVAGQGLLDADGLVLGWAFFVWLGGVAGLPGTAVAALLGFAIGRLLQPRLPWLRGGPR
jgi:hypothetical protein